MSQLNQIHILEMFLFKTRLKLSLCHEISSEKVVLSLCLPNGHYSGVKYSHQFVPFATRLSHNIKLIGEIELPAQRY